jgi:hypothetical protein
VVRNDDERRPCYVDGTTLFDITTKPFDWSVLVAPLGLFLLGFFLIWMENKKIGKFGIRKIGYILSAVGILAALCAGAAWSVKRHDGSLALQTGRYRMVEGTVRNFHPMLFAGHPPESFAIENERFSYSDYDFTACFNRTASHGGPLREGLHIRIYYIDNCILKIELLIAS